MENIHQVYSYLQSNNISKVQKGFKYLAKNNYIFKIENQDDCLYEIFEKYFSINNNNHSSILNEINRVTDMIDLKYVDSFEFKNDDFIVYNLLFKESDDYIEILFKVKDKYKNLNTLHVKDNMKNKFSEMQFKLPL